MEKKKIAFKKKRPSETRVQTAFSMIE